MEKNILSAGKFICGITILFIVFGFLFSLLPLEWIEYFFAWASLSVLGFFGFGGTLAMQEPVLIELASFTTPIGISYLCTGILEASVVMASVLASFGIDARKRIIGAILGLGVVAVFNIARIVLSILIISWFGLDAGNFSHDVLFKLFLIVTIAGFYYFWFWWAIGKTGFGVSQRL